MKSQPEKACSSCRGSGWLVKTEDGVDSVVPCPDCRSEDRLRQLLKKAAIPPRYFDKEFDQFSHNPQKHPLQSKALTRAVKYVHDFPDVPRGLLFAGPCGVGKTHLSVVILKAVIQEQMVAGTFVDEAELLRRLQYSYGPGSPETEREVMIPLSEVDLLVWDDLGTGRPTDWVRETIRTVINHRYTHKKLTILSTNWSLEPRTERSFRPDKIDKITQQTLEERIGKHLFSRILEMCEIVRVDGPDGRRDIHKASQDQRKTESNDSDS